MTLPRTLRALCVPMLLDAAAAQVANEFDFDLTQLPPATITPNGASHAITSEVTYVGQNLTLHTPLTVRSGGQLVLLRSVLTVYGGLTIERGARVTVIDSSLLVANAYSGQYTLRNEGGLLHTERAVFGTANLAGVVHQAPFHLLRGTWLARNTVVQGLAVMISEGRQGWYGDPALKGGSVFADGIYEGTRADAIHLSGMGDVTLANGSMNVGIFYDASVAGQPATSVVDLEARVPLTAVYGDPNVHTGVTLPIANAACRLELSSHRSRTWSLTAVEVTGNGPQQTITLRNAADAIVSVRASNLTGTPVLSGPWSSHYAELPGLPSTARPGFHRIPPGCAVGIGNVTFRSGNGPDDWNAIYGWGLYLRGAATDFTVNGPSMISETLLYEGRLRLAGTRSYDMGFGASTAQTQATAILSIDNATIGDLGRWPNFVGLIEACDSSRCSITRARVGQLRLRTTSPGALIDAQHVIGVQNLTTDTAAGGVVQVAQATAAEPWDLQNLDLDAPGGSVPYWAVAGFAGTLVGDKAPGAPGSASRELIVQGTPATVQKQLSLPPDTYVTVLASTKMLQSSGPAPQLRAGQGGSAVVVPISAAPNVWRRTAMPLFVVDGSGLDTFVGLHASANATLRLDDVQLRVSSWWDVDNFANLAFEGGYRYHGQALSPETAPDSWAVSKGTTCAADVVVRPGAAAGSRSVRLSTSGFGVGIHKAWTFLRAGDVLTVSGWARANSPNPAAVILPAIGNGDAWYLPGAGSQNVPLPCDGAWHSFTLNYTVPANPSYTHLELGCYDYAATAGVECWYDDITVSVQ